VEIDLLLPLSNNCLANDAVTLTSDLSLATISLEAPRQFPPFSSGRDVCALKCTLLL